MKRRLLLLLIICVSIYIFRDDIRPLMGGMISDRVFIEVSQLAQKPELARGCEVTALAMMLNHAGVDVSKMELAEKVKKLPFEENGLKGNPSEGFVGDIYTFTNPGLGVYHKPIEELAREYLPDRIINISGENFNRVIDYLNNKKPVWVIHNAKFSHLPANEWQTWETGSGTIEITYQEHSVLVTGYDKDWIYFNDPLTGQTEKADKISFIEGWEQMGSQAITYQ